MLETGKSFSIRGQVEVTGFCYQPIISCLSSYKRLTYRRQDKITVPGKAFSVLVNCSDGGVNTTYTLMKENGEDVSDKMRVFGNEVIVAAFTLAYGLYNLSYQVTMESSPALTAFSQLTLEIVPSAIEVQFEGGIYQMASLNEQLQIRVSVDNPDFPGQRDEDVRFAWFCYQEEETELDDPPLIDIPTDSKMISYISVIY